MDQSGGLKIAAVLVLAMLGFSTLAVGVQLSSGGSDAVTHDQTATQTGTQGVNQTDSACLALTTGSCDLTFCDSALFDGVSSRVSLFGSSE